ncbi:MAG: hypothetical protein QOE82_286 [Thermoanaerobaculia bacterium]|jgi:uncharacterized damage-inducible protein DinB|nr:hypothetical protein [Thermoanaerobaculia bacterium]
MTLAELYLPDFNNEMSNTRRVLERVPTAKFEYKPHEKSWKMGGLATHVANLPTWASLIIGNDSFDIAPAGQPPMRAPEQKSTEELLAYFDKNVKSARAAIESASDDTLLGEWTLLGGGHKILSDARHRLLRNFVLHHLIHHRAQLTVYMRLNDIPLPGLYGPTADEK